MYSKQLHNGREILAFTFFLFFTLSLHSQIQVQGLIADNEGAASWNADGSGPEPYGVGHSTFTYYIASRDYVNPSAAAGAHVTSIGTDFPLFAQALTDNGFTPGQVIVKLGLASLGNDLEGEDWFTFGNEHHLNFYPISTLMTINDEPMISGITNYMMFNYGASTGWTWQMESNFFVAADASGNSSAAVKAVAAAFLLDVAGHELRFNFQSLGSTVPFTGNGRNGSYRNISGNIEKGRPELAFQGLAVNHEGFAGWDADGTGPEPKRDGHSSQKYYVASRDYDDIDPDPNAGFARLLGENGSGFQNFALQLQYRGFTPEQVKFKMGLRDLGEDVEGEDWSYNYPIHAVNFYHSDITAEINGEKVFGFVCDTARTYQNSNNPALGWWGTSAITSVYDASENSSEAIQAIAASFFKDMQNRQIQTVTTLSTYANETFSGNGRIGGGFWQINEAKMVAMPMKGTQVLPGDVSGHWTMDGHPYTVNGDITIPDGQTLTIDPGVWVKFSDRILFNVEGTIIAAGDSCNTGCIVFTAVNPELGWGHIGFDNTPNSNSTSVFKHCIFEYGSAPQAVPYNSGYNCGGALAIRNYNNIIIENCLFHHNRALYDAYYPASGGAIALWTSNPEIRNCIFMDNTARCAGGIEAAFESSPNIANCLFINNKSLRTNTNGGGAINIFSSSSPVLLNNTFVNNHSNFQGGAIEIYNGSNPVFINNIFWNNTAPQYNEIFISTNNCNVDFKYNDIEGGQAGIGPNGIGTGVYENNIDADPVFADALALDYQLGAGSPCIDAGIPDVTGLNLPWIDLLGNCRIWDGGVNGAIVDMGPYEYGSIPCVVGIEKINPGNSAFELTNYPNPFTGSTTIEFSLTAAAVVTISIYNHLGQLVTSLLNERLTAGIHRAGWNADNLPEGVYLCRLQMDHQTFTQRMIKIR